MSTHPDEPHTPTARPVGDASAELFLSYNSANRSLVQDVQRLLVERNISTFLDRDQLFAGMPWASALQEAIGRARAVAVFVGDEGISTWQKREMDAALVRQAAEEKEGKSFPVIPVVLPGADLEKAPAFLLLNTWVDLRSETEKSSELDRLARAVQGEVPEPRTEAPIALCPYKALRAFREEDAALFFGREAFSTELLEKTLNNSLVAVVGASGSGKSSVVQAGLLPLLRRQKPPAETWDAIVFTPGKHPFRNLAAALVPLWETELSATERLREAGGLGTDLENKRVPLESAINQALQKSKGTDRLLIVVDQFEELFTLTPEAERRDFIDSLFEAAASTKLTVLITLRADFYGQAIDLSRLMSDSIQRGLVNLGPMTEAELRLAIENPARAVGLNFQDGLVNRILERVVDQPGNLPLLEFALTELWDDGRSRLLTNARYDEIGGVEGAISKRAETEFKRLSSDEQEVMLRFLSRLVRVASAGEEGSDTRQRVNLNEFDQTTRAVVQSFVNARLFVTSGNLATKEETVEVSHEALIKRWPLLRELINKNRDFLLWRQRLGHALSEWQRMERNEGALLREAYLTEAKGWLKERESDLNEAEKEFIRTSSRLDVKSKRVRQWAVGATAAVLLIAVASVAAWWFYTRSASYQIKTIMGDAPRIIHSAEAQNASQWVRALFLVGEENRAMETAGSISDPADRSLVFLAIAREQAKAGKKDAARETVLQSLQSINQIPHEFDRTRPLALLAFSLNNIGMTEEAVKAAKTIRLTPTTPASYDYDSLIPIIIKAGRVDEMLSASRQTFWDMRKRILLRLAVELGNVGQNEKASDVVNEIIKAADERPGLEIIENLYLQIADYGDIASVLAQIGRIDDALVYARKVVSMQKAVDVRLRNTQNRPPPRGDPTSTFSQIAQALAVKEDKLEQAFAIVREEVSKDSQHEVFANVANALADAKKMEAARKAADEALTAFNSYVPTGGSEQEIFERKAESFTSSILRVLCKVGKIEEALTELRKIKEKTADYDGRDFIVVAETLAREGQAERALAVAGEISDDKNRAEAFNSLASILINSGRKAEAGQAATGVLTAVDKIKEPYPRGELLAKIAVILNDVGRTGEAKKAVDQAFEDAGKIPNDESSSEDYARVATTLARIGDFYRALQAASACRLSKDKLTAYTAILLEYHRRRNPGLAKLLEAEERDKTK